MVVPVLSQCYCNLAVAFSDYPCVLRSCVCVVAIPEERTPKQNRVVVAVYDQLCLVVDV